MLNTRSVGRLTATVPVLLISVLPVVLAPGPFQSQQSGSVTKPDAPSAGASSGCHEPQPEHPKPQATDAVHACRLRLGSGILNIGMAEHKPFTAEESVKEWRALPSDKKERRNLKKKLMGWWKTSPDGTKMTRALIPEWIARDSAGRVLQTLSWGGLDTSDGSSYWQGSLCDPLTQRITSFNISQPLPPDPNFNDDRVFQAFQASQAFQECPGCRAFIFDKPTITWLPLPAHDVYRSHRWGPADKGWKVLDLGYQEMSGIRVHGHRWWFARGGNFVDGDFKELWISEELQVDVLYIEESQTKGKGTRAELTHVRTKELNSGWFQIPEGVPAHVVEHKVWPGDPCATAAH